MLSAALAVLLLVYGTLFSRSIYELVTTVTFRRLDMVGLPHDVKHVYLHRPQFIILVRKTDKKAVAIRYFWVVFCSLFPINVTAEYTRPV